jgi:SAM-dependent methyltransferase
VSEDVKSIHEFDVSLICEYYSTLERQGPGSPEVTVKALSFVDNLTAESKIADIGCGTGGQTMVVANHTPGHIIGVDLFPTFIDLFNANARTLDLQDRVKGVVGSMDQLTFEKEELDLIWSEGAIYNIGFERGVNEWRRFLKPGGFLAVSEAAWFTDERPTEIEEFWNDAYPEIDTIPRKLDQLQKAGYVPIAAFVVPDECWLKNFYAPQVLAQEEFLETHAGNKAAEDFIANQRWEIELYNKYKEFYGYAFFIGRKS